MDGDRLEPTADELAGMTWWNGLPEPQRAYWVRRVGTGVAADAWGLFKANQYRIEAPALAAAIADATPSSKHQALLKAIHRVEGYEGAKLVRVDDGGISLVRRKVLRADGSLVHDDHKAWLREQLAADGGQVRVTRARLEALDLRLSLTSVVVLRVIVDRGGDQANITQVTVHQHRETLERRLFDPLGGWRTPHDLEDLVDDARGPELPEDQRCELAPASYHLHDVVDIAAFVREAQVLHRARTEAASKRRYEVTDVDLSASNSERVIRTGAELDPQWDRFPCRERRIFDDWTLSSAGRSGARLCDHWTFQISDGFVGADRYMSFVTEWATARKVGKIETRNLNSYELYGKLQALDARVGVPFGWYFYMLHGNRVTASAGERVLNAAEAGTIVMPEHDYRILKGWESRGYGF